MVRFAESAPSLQWDANPPNEQVTNYKIYEKIGQNFTLVGTVDGKTTTYSLAGVPEGQHIYAVSAVNITGESSKSTETILPATPSVPVNPRVVP
jgi:hypothetical protein